MIPGRLALHPGYKRFEQPSSDRPASERMGGAILGDL
jgi:hypothetical protein